MYKQRLAKLQQLAQDKNIDYVVIVPGANLFYFTGLQMGMSERPTMAILPATGEPFFYCPSFEASKIHQVTGFKRCVTYTDEEGPYQAMEQWVKEQGITQAVLAFEYRAARLLEYMVINKALTKTTLVDARPVMATLRMQKDEQELALMERAGELADIMMKGVREALVPGATEGDLRRAASIALAQAEPDADVAFISVASGPRGALPHAGQADRKINNGELVVIDLGANYKGYCSDITRTLPLGEISEELMKAYEVVRLANEKGKEVTRIGISCQDVDRATRALIVEQGYGEYFTHRTGHGLGIEVHEEPYIVEGNELQLKEGMAFTVEPGVYLPNIAGIRIEDDVVVTADGCRSLTNFPRHLVY